MCLLLCACPPGRCGENAEGKLFSSVCLGRKQRILHQIFCTNLLSGQARIFFSRTRRYSLTQKLKKPSSNNFWIIFQVSGDIAWPLHWKIELRKAKKNVRCRQEGAMLLLFICLFSSSKKTMRTTLAFIARLVHLRCAVLWSWLCGQAELAFRPTVLHNSCALISRSVFVPMFKIT